MKQIVIDIIYVLVQLAIGAFFGGKYFGSFEGIILTSMLLGSIAFAHIQHTRLSNKIVKLENRIKELEKNKDAEN